MENTKRINPYIHEPKKGVSWRAIFAGTLTVLSIVLILNLLGIAIGLSTIDPTEEANPFSGIGIGAIIWWTVSNLIALFAGGFVAARVGVSFSDTSGAIQGIMTWALYALVSAWLLTTAIGSVISGVGSAVGGVISTTGQVAGDAFGPAIKEQFEELGESLGDAKDEFYSLMRDAGVDADDLESNLGDDVSRGMRDGGVEQAFRNARNRLTMTFEEVDRTELVNILVNRTDMNRQEAERAVDNALADYEALRQEVEEFLEEAEEMAREQGEKLAETGAKAAGYLAIALIIGLISAAFGGIFGVKDLRDDYEENYVEPGPGYGSTMHTEQRAFDRTHPANRPNPADRSHLSDEPFDR